MDRKLYAAFAGAALLLPALPAVASQQIAPTASAPAQVVPAAVYSARVERVIDGQTLELVRDDKSKVIVRLFGVSAPAANTPEGKKAQEYLSDALKDQPVRVTERGKVTTTSGPVTLAMVEAQGQVPAPPRPSRPGDVNKISQDLPYVAQSNPLPPFRDRPTNFATANYGVIRTGLARFSPQTATADRDAADKLREAEQAARKDGAGLWKGQSGREPR